VTGSVEIGSTSSKPRTPPSRGALWTAAADCNTTANVPAHPGISNGYLEVPMRRKSMAVAGLAAAFVAAGALAAPSASAEELPGCRIWASAPVYDNGIVRGVGHRDGCGQDRTIRVRIREDRLFQVDITMAERSWTGVVNGTFVVPWYCPQDADGDYFTEILTSAGGKSSSARVRLPC
jgi:hypothetical protein